MVIRRTVRDFLAAGPLPGEDQPIEAITRAQELLMRIEAPVTSEEASALLDGFGPDDCYGLAWTLLHLIETAPGAQAPDYPAGADNLWIQTLRRRAANAAPVALMHQAPPGGSTSRRTASIDWARLGHAYGSAEDIPGLLAQARSGPDDRASGELWSRLCHQGTVYSASYAALPELAAIARGRTAGQRFDLLVLAAAIVASRDVPHDTPDIPQVDPKTVAELADLTEQELLAHGPGTGQQAYVYLLQAALGLAGVEPWGTELELLNNNECEVECPDCFIENFVVFGEHGHFSTLDAMYFQGNDSGRVPLLPADPAGLSGTAADLHARALASGYPDLARNLTFVFGRARCADCGATFRVDEAIAARQAY